RYVVDPDLDVRSAGQRLGHQGLPGERADHAVWLEPFGLLERADPGLGLRAEDAVHVQRVAVPAVAEVGLVLDGPHGRAGTAEPDRDDQRAPGLRADHAVGGQVTGALERDHGRLGLRAEDAVGREL